MWLLFHLLLVFGFGGRSTSPTWSRTERPTSEEGDGETGGERCRSTGEIHALGQTEDVDQLDRHRAGAACGCGGFPRGVSSWVRTIPIRTPDPMRNPRTG